MHQNLCLMLVYDPASPAGVLNTLGFYFVVKTIMTGVWILIRLLVGFVPVGHRCSHPFLKSSSDYKISGTVVWIKRACFFFLLLNFWFLMFELVIPSVSSFVRKTTEKIGTLHISPESRGKHEAKDDEQLPELTLNPVASPQEEKEWVQNHIFLKVVFAGCPEDSNLRKISFKQNEEHGIRFFWLLPFLWCISVVFPTPFLELMRQWTQS